MSSNGFSIIWPYYGRINQRLISQRFGVNKSYYQQFGLNGHDGIDIVNRYGSMVVAPTKGEIFESRTQVELGYKHNLGLHVRIRFVEPDGQIWICVLGHLSSCCVKVGQWVEAGQVIGLTGNTGLVSPKPTSKEPKAGTHLHLGLYKVGSNKAGWRKGQVNPEDFFVTSS